LPAPGRGAPARHRAAGSRAEIVSTHLEIERIGVANRLTVRFDLQPCSALTSGSSSIGTTPGTPSSWLSGRETGFGAPGRGPSNEEDAAVMTRKIRTVIVDDEPLARERIAMLLANEPDIEIVAQCRDGEEAIAAIRDHAPDLVFLDVQMPQMSGFDVIDAVGAGRMPLVIFVTAYDEHALRAFEVKALDYLLKPFDRERFADALERARKQIEREETGDLGRRLLALVKDLRPSQPKPDRLVVKSAGRLFYLRMDEIDWIEAAGNYVRLHVGPTSHLLRETMNAIEGRLDPEKFFRIHRSRIVNMERIQEMQPWLNGEYAVLLRTGTRLTLSRGYREKLQERLARGV
jgi:two-component system LytT family response regulator